MPDMNWFLGVKTAAMQMLERERFGEVEFIQQHQGIWVAFHRLVGSTKARQLVALNTPQTGGEVPNGAGGQSGTQTIILLGDGGFDVQIGDIFMYRQTRYKVVFVDRSGQSRTMATCEANR